MCCEFRDVSFSISPGLGWGMTIVSGIMTIYYNVIISWILYYLGHSFYRTLPWATCDNAWNTPGCLERRSRSKEAAFNASLADSNSTQVYSDASQFYSNVTEMLMGVTTENTAVTPEPSVVIVGNETFVRRTPAEEFWEWVIIMTVQTKVPSHAGSKTSDNSIICSTNSV